MTKSEEPEAEAELLARIDAELRSALDLEPSSRFREGVWRRIEERQRRWAFLRGLMVPAAATVVAAALVILAAGGREGGRPAVPAPERELRAADAPLPAPPSPAPPSPVPPPRPRPEAMRSVAARPPARPPSEASAEVLVPEEQRELLRRLIRRLDRTSVFADPGSGAGPTMGVEIEPLQVERIAIEPIRIEP